MRDLTIRENFQLLMGGNRKRIHRKLKGGDPFSMVTAAIISGAVAYQTKDLILGRVGVGEDLVLNIEQPSAEEIKYYFDKKRELEEKIIKTFDRLKKFALKNEKKFCGSELKFPDKPKIDKNIDLRNLISKNFPNDKEYKHHPDTLFSDSERRNLHLSRIGAALEEEQNVEWSINPVYKKQETIGEWQQFTRAEDANKSSSAEYSDKLTEEEWRGLTGDSMRVQIGGDLGGGGGQKIGTMLDILLNGIQ